MTSRERLLAAFNGLPSDQVPMTTWCFGFQAPKHLRWETNGREVEHWYSGRLEHIHTLPQPWEPVDELRRAKAWLSLGVDDVLEVSVPWSQDPEVAWRDSVVPAGAPGGDASHSILVRDYETPSGPLRHAVRKTDGAGAGWVVQPDFVPLFEDYNIPRAAKHVVSSPSDVKAVRHLFRPPGAEQRRWFADRMATMKRFADESGLLVQAWPAFGMDAAVWLAGPEGAVLMAVDAPEAFRQLMDAIFETDHARTEVAVTTPGVDMVCQRGWYSSTDFWSPRLFDSFTLPQVSGLAALAHRHGKKFAYVMTTGVETLGPRLAAAGVDVLFFVDPVQDRIALERARDLLADRMTLVGGANSVSLTSGDPRRIREEVRRAMEVLGPTRRFILHPVDAIFPDTPWTGVEAMIDAWRELRTLN